MEELNDGTVLASEPPNIPLSKHATIVRDIHHRVNNNLQVLISILSLQARRTRHDEAAKVLQQTQSRFRAVASLHDPLYSTKDFSTVHFGDYLEALARQLKSFYNVGSNVQLTVSASDMALIAENALPLALVANELLSNALKHAFSNGSSGNITVSLRYASPTAQDAPREFGELSITDDGIGLPTAFDFDTAESMGFFLVRVFTRQLRGSVRIQTNPGTSICISFQTTT